jgi:hypothetical protein
VHVHVMCYQVMLACTVRRAALTPYPGWSLLLSSFAAAAAAAAGSPASAAGCLQQHLDCTQRI